MTKADMQKVIKANKNAFKEATGLPYLYGKNMFFHAEFKPIFGDYEYPNEERVTYYSILNTPKSEVPLRVQIDVPDDTVRTIRISTIEYYSDEILPMYKKRYGKPNKNCTKVEDFYDNKNQKYYSRLGVTDQKGCMWIYEAFRIYFVKHEYDYEAKSYKEETLRELNGTTPDLDFENGLEIYYEDYAYRCKIQKIREQQAKEDEEKERLRKIEEKKAKEEKVNNQDI